MMQFDRPVAVGYIRVSTERQGRSGLGLDAQRAAVEAFCAQRSLSLDSVFVEVETGKRADRPELAKAFAKARRMRGVVVLAKMDRLARNVAFVSKLMEQGAAFACVDAPDDDAFMLHIRASVAEDEARKISRRTREALAQAKARGVRLGNPQNLTDAGRKLGSRNAGAVRRAQGELNRAAIRDAVLDGRSRGLSLRAIAEEVGVSFMTVKRVIDAEGTK